MNCRICDGALVSFLCDVADSLTGERFSIDRCSRCGVGQTLPWPDDLERYYASYHGNRHGLAAAYCVGRRMRLLHDAARAGGGKRLLDIGCGDGSFLAAAKKAGWHASGTELKPRAARSLGLDVRCGIEQFDLGEGFDCVTLWHSLEHLRDPLGTLSQARDRLAPQGVVLVAVPDNGGWQARIFGRHWLHLDVPRHLFHFDQRSLDGLLERAGLTPRRHWHQEIEYDLLGWSQSALNAVGPAPNVFFHSLIGKPVAAGKLVKAAHLGGGAVLSAAAVPLVVVCGWLHRGGTLIAAAGAGR